MFVSSYRPQKSKPEGSLVTSQKLWTVLQSYSIPVHSTLITRLCLPLEPAADGSVPPLFSGNVIRLAASLRPSNENKEKRRLTAHYILYVYILYYKHQTLYIYIYIFNSYLYAFNLHLKYI